MSPLVSDIPGRPCVVLLLLLLVLEGGALWEQRHVAVLEGGVHVGVSVCVLGGVVGGRHAVVPALVPATRAVLALPPPAQPTFVSSLDDGKPDTEHRKKQLNLDSI